MAAILGLVNDARLRAGQPVVGFANPWLYSAASQLFNDVTAGQSQGCNGTNLQSGRNVTGGGVIPYATWNATVGWDPVTGLGTPDFMKMKDWKYIQPAPDSWGSWWNWGGGGNWGN